MTGFARDAGSVADHFWHGKGPALTYDAAMKWLSRFRCGMQALLIALFPAALLAGLAVPARALETSLQYVLTFEGNVERVRQLYACDQAEELIMVEYLNAPPNFLAIVPVGEDAEPLIFSNVLSASGVRYASGFYIWWTKGAEATLYDLRLRGGSEDDPMPSQAVLTCLEYSDIP